MNNTTFGQLRWGDKFIYRNYVMVKKAGLETNEHGVEVAYNAVDVKTNDCWMMSDTDNVLGGFKDFANEQ